MQVGLTRRNIGRLVLLAWAVALAWLAQREFAGAPTSTAERARGLEPGAQYFAVLAGDRQIGQLNRTLDTLVDGVRLTELLVLDVPEGDSTRQLARLLEMELTRGLRLRRLVRSVFGIGPRERLEGVLGPDSLLSIRNFEAEAPAGTVIRLPTGPDPMLPAMLPLRAAMDRRLAPGTRFTVPFLDLGTGATRPLEITVAAESTFVLPDSAQWSPAEERWVAVTYDTIRAFRLEHAGIGLPVETWVDGQGALVGETVGGGYVLQRSAFEIVNTQYRTVRRSETGAWRRQVPGMVGLVGSGKRPGAGPGSARLVLPARPGVPGSGFPNPLETADWWNAPGNWLRRTWDAIAPNDSALREAAAAAVAGARSGTDSVARLTRWVAARIGTEANGFGTAHRALRAGRGSADGKARLLVSLARALRIPARVIRGVALLPDGVYGHAWAELWIGRWITADPAFGMVPAAPSLVPAGIGERSRPVDLVPLLASARFLPPGASR